MKTPKRLFQRLPPDALAHGCWCNRFAGALLSHRSSKTGIRQCHPWILYIALGATRLIAAGDESQSIIERGPHHRVWVNVTSAVASDGKTVLRTNRYTELANGICYQNQNGDWLDSKEVIDIVPGGALASQGAHQVGFAANINTRGAINMLTPDGKRLRSHVLGLAYTDAKTGKSILIAEVRDSIGELVGQNQVIYRGAFAEFRADVRYTYTLAGLEQDIVLRDNPPSPDAYGLNPVTTRLEVFTEFIETSLPEIVPATLSATVDPIERATMLLPDFVDQNLKFGAMEIGSGQAFPLSDENNLPERAVPTGKTWEQKDGRTFLIEAVEYPAIKPHLDALAAKAAAKQEAKAHPGRTFPPARAQAKKIETMKMASVRPKETGFVIDYIITSGVTNFRFAADTTYYVGGSAFLLWGTPVIEGGTVIKYTNGLSAPQLRFAGVDCRTSPFRPAIATSMHDDTVGNIIGGSTGNPTNYCGYMFWLGHPSGGYFNLHDLRVSHAYRAFYGTAKANADISNCQIRHSMYAFKNNTAFWNLRNVLVSDVTFAFSGDTPLTNNAEHVTFHSVSNFVAAGLPAVNLTNSLLIGVTNGVSWVGTGVETNLSGAGIFQTVGSGSFYLSTNSAYRDVGTTNINPTLRSALRQMTTYPPQMWTGIVTTATSLAQTTARDTNILDLGYHYFPIDWLSGSVFVSAPVTLAEGAVLAIGNATISNAHVQLNGGAQFIASGSPLAPARITQPGTVQEQPTVLDASWRPLFDEGTNITSSTVPTVQFRFADLTTFRANQYYFYTYLFASIELTHSQVRGGDIQYGGFTPNAWTKTFAVTNTLFERTAMWLGGNDTAFRLHMRNALAYGGSVSFSPTNASTVWTVENSSFDGTTLWQYAAFTNQNNAYISNATPLLNASNSLTLSNFTYDTGPLGFYYQRTNSLANKGTNTANTLGLYHFTTTTNQVKETNSVVDIGFHYVALTMSNTPVDTDGDGLSDHYEDMNGNGLVDSGELNWTEADTDGDGLSDAFELLVTHTDPNNADSNNTGVLDGYKDSDGDGWTNLDEMRNGTDPLQFNTPASPGNLRVDYTPGATNVTITWQPARGAVTGYVVRDFEGNVVATVGTNVFEIIDAPEDLEDWPWYQPRYSVQATYAGGTSETSDYEFPGETSLTIDPYLVRGPEGGAYLAISGLSERAATVALRWAHSFGETIYQTSISRTSFVNGICRLTNAIGPSDFLWAQVIATNGDIGVLTSFFPELSSTEEAGTGSYTPDGWGFHPFVDMRAALQDNLVFQLRAALGSSFDFSIGIPPPSMASQEPRFASYEYSGFHTIDGSVGNGDDARFQLDPLFPLWKNHWLRNFVFDTNDFAANGSWQTGAGVPYVLFSPTKYQFNPSLVSTGGIFSSLIATSQFIVSDGVELSETCPSQYNCSVTMASNRTNFFGLPFLSDTVVWTDTNVITHFSQLSAGGTLPEPGAGGYSVSFANVQTPNFQTGGYYFAQGNPDFLPSYLAPVPGTEAFTVTNATPLFIAPVGQPFFVSGWAKKQITNGYANRFAYLEQFFDKAYKADTNGNATTNQTGILSEYGEFFPTEPGPAVLKTKPDIQTSEVGQAIINVIHVGVDANHDGEMNLTFGGPDNTSPQRPYLFWINSDSDVFNSDEERDVDANNPSRPDYSDDRIETTRDLEDFARFWIAGMLSNSQFSVTLSFNVSVGAPVIQLFRAYETNGGTGYLTDTNIAAEQIRYTNSNGTAGPGKAFARISQNSPFTFPAGFFATNGNRYFLFEGAGIGIGDLVLTIYMTNAGIAEVVATTSTSLDIRDGRNLYERTHIEGVDQFAFTNVVTTNMVSTFKNDNTLPTTANEPKQIIVFVHGFNMSQFDYDSFSATMYKRLYWAGYRGRFASLRWPTLSTNDFGEGVNVFQPAGELIAFHSGRGASLYFDSLRTRFPDYSINVAAHSMGNMVMMEALKQQLAAGHQALDNYVLMEAVTPAHCYDTNLANYAKFTNVSHLTPDTYRGYPGAINNALRGQMANFFNTNDFVLAKGKITTDLGEIDANWEAGQLFFKDFSVGVFGYYPTATNGLHVVAGQTNLVTNPYELMAFVSLPRSKAVGASPGVHGVIAGSEFDLRTIGFDLERFDHSGQFNRNVQQVRPFYLELLDRFDF